VKSKSAFQMPLKDVITLQRGFDLPESKRQNGDIPVVASTGVIGTHTEVRVCGPGVVIGRSGSIGGGQYITNDFWPLNTTLWVKDFKGHNPLFIYYMLKNIDFVPFNAGAGVPTLNRNHLDSLIVPVFDPDREQYIADILSAYDGLIENNQRRIVLLEEAAQHLYSEWFVRLRFPGHEHTRSTNGVPEGWESVPTPDAVVINPRTSLSNEEEHWFVEMADLPTGSMVIQQARKREGRSGSKFQNGDTLFARITPCLENGKTAFVDFMAEGEVGRGSTEFIVLRSKQLAPEFVYCLARTYDFRENAIKSMIGSSGRQRVQESCFEKFLVRVPPRTLLNLFTESARPMFDQIKGLHTQNQKLRAARDLLLPRLMNGEIAV
jgi:type I restriction enzyme S subunit